MRPALAPPRPGRAAAIAVIADGLHGPVVGVPRYLREILPLLADRIETITPPPRRGRRGQHVWWEQVLVPARLGGRLLWSPGGTGPLLVRHQVVTVHDMAAFDHPEWLNRELSAWLRFLLRRLLPRVRHVIAVSEFTRSRVLALTRLPPERVTAIPHGVSARFAPQSPERIAQMRQTLGLPAAPYLLSVGTLEPRKNLRRLLRAWAIAQPEAPDTILVLAGRAGPAADFGRHDAGPLPGRTRWLGHVPDGELPALYAGAEAFAYVSLYEGFGFPPLEAMAAGAPVVASNQTALPEVVGDAGILVPPEDVGAIAAALVRVLASPSLRRDLSVRGRARARCFSWPRAAQATGDLLERLR